MNDLVGQKFGRLLVVCDSGKRNYENRIIWGCACECGNPTGATTTQLRCGEKKSCGCLRRKIPQEVEGHDIIGRMMEFEEKTYEKRYLYRHGDNRNGKTTRLYSIWASMKGRCKNHDNPSYKYYGERGIKICNEWKNNYITFKNWALRNGYQNNLTIDRIDNDGNYEPSNCQWITRGKNNIKAHKGIKHEGNLYYLPKLHKRLHF